MKKIINHFLPALLLLLGSFSASAQNVDDFGIWSSFQITKSWDKPYAYFRGEIRTCQNTSAIEAWFTAIGAGYKFAPWIKADMGYEYWRFPSSGNTTTHKGILAVTGTLKRENLAFVLREKYEFTHSSATGAYAHNFRTRVRSQYSFDNVPLTPYIMIEPFISVGKGWYRTLHYVGTEIGLAKHHKLDVFYLYNLYSATPSVNARHLIGVYYYINF